MAPAATRTHVYVDLANPYLACGRCGRWVTGWHNNEACGCDAQWWNMPCGCERAELVGVCPSWEPAHGCRCEQGELEHGDPTTPSEEGVVL